MCIHDKLHKVCMTLGSKIQQKHYSQLKTDLMAVVRVYPFIYNKSVYEKEIWGRAELRAEVTDNFIII